MESSRHFQGIENGVALDVEELGMAVARFVVGMKVVMNSSYSPEKKSSPIFSCLY